MGALDPTKARLLEAAGEEFAERGFDGATVRSICARAGANVAAINYHFGDKEQLYAQALIEAHRCGIEMIDERELLALEPAEQLRRYVRHFLTHVLAVNRSDDWHHVLMMREMVQPTDACDRLVREVIRPKFERLEAILRRIRPDLEGRALLATAFSVIGQCLHYRMGREVARRLVGPETFATLDLDFLTDHITNFTLAALDDDRREAQWTGAGESS